MTWTLNGLPLHVLLVHFVVVVVPLAALVTLAAGVWPAARRRIGILSPIIALAALISVPITTQAGEALERMVGHSDLIEEHTRLGDTLLPWAIAVFVLATAHRAWFRIVVRDRARDRDRAPRADAAAATGTPPPARVSPTLRRVVALALAAAMTVTAIGSVVTVVLIGESGSRAVWTGELDSSG